MVVKIQKLITQPYNVNVDWVIRFLFSKHKIDLFPKNQTDYEYYKYNK